MAGIRHSFDSLEVDDILYGQWMEVVRLCQHLSGFVQEMTRCGVPSNNIGKKPSE
jgi:hypothetical protein